MKKTLSVLSILYFVMCIPMFLVPLVVFLYSFSPPQGVSADRVLMMVFSLVFSIIPLVGSVCCIRYLVRKDVASACNISILTGVVIWALLCKLLPLIMIFCHVFLVPIAFLTFVALGVIAHKAFQKEIIRYYDGLTSVNLG